ncbi:unnamed protein product [Hermetia illucens]|nr:unnamed protein product [Hermetia illucens]
MMIAAVMADTTMTIPMITTNNSRDGDDVHLCAPFTHSICTVLQCPDSGAVGRVVLCSASSVCVSNRP